MFIKKITEKIENVPKLISRLGLLVIVLIAGLTFWSANEYIKSVRWRTHSHQVIGQIRVLNLAFHEALAHQRGYFISPDRNAEKLYYQAKDAVRSGIYQLGLLISDNPDQMSRLDKASTNILSRLSSTDSAMESLQRNDKNIAFLNITEDIRQSHNNETSYFLSQLEQEELRLLAAREDSARNGFIRISILVLGGLITAFLLFFSSTFLWQREMGLRFKAEHDLQETNRKIKKASDLKTSFLTNMSHEIRTPLNGITGMVKLLEHTTLSPQQLDYVETIKTSSSALLSLINDILDLSKIESGKFQLEEINFEMASLMKSTLSIVDFAAKSKKLNLKVDIDPELPDFFMGDPLRLRQVLLNLLNNAIKFSDQGDVTLRVTYKTLPDQTVRVYFEVRDQGIGFDNETKARLFQNFSQGDDSTSRKYGGSGLGLSISKQIVDMMKGHIDAESVKGMGSKFFFEVPLKIASYDTKAETVVSIRDLNNHLHGYVLIAEDNRINQKVMTEMVGLLGCRCYVVANGQEVLNALSNDTFDVILMDGQMPVMDGYEATRLIREGKAGERNKLIPILATSANAIKGDIERSLEAGMNDYISKPIAYNDLSVKLEKWLRQGTAVIDESHIDKLRRQENLSGKILVPELVSIFLQDTPQGLRQMQHDLSQNNFKSVRSVAHNLKTSAAILGAIRFKEIAERIERAPDDITDEQMANLISSLEREMGFAIESLKSLQTGPITNHEPESNA